MSSLPPKKRGVDFIAVWRSCPIFFFVIVGCRPSSGWFFRGWCCRVLGLLLAVLIDARRPRVTLIVGVPMLLLFELSSEAGYRLWTGFVAFVVDAPSAGEGLTPSANLLRGMLLLNRDFIPVFYADLNYVVRRVVRAAVSLTALEFPNAIPIRGGLVAFILLA
ncbi:hypothetical protein Nepgr_002585 [Nepenthes gracilis]|uniref:Uncharacterized protein n=1 Tax=Nepenthes gracilis TaxID=150966 RepID=A0AAD3P6J1_NEPGR|nr:hypothetical protein Nepgr_002585 [Nepenthes gracilis]